jgi:hypothetical protein
MAQTQQSTPNTLSRAMIFFDMPGFTFSNIGNRLIFVTCFLVLTKTNFICYSIHSGLVIYSMQIGFRGIRQSYFYSHQSKKLRCNRLLQCFLMKLWVKRTSIKTEKLFGLCIYTRGHNLNS